MPANDHPTRRFHDRAEDYARYRPGYPADAVDALLQGLPTACTVADVGAGTGILCRFHSLTGVVPATWVRAACAVEKPEEENG